MGVLWLRKSVEQLSYEYNISIKENKQAEECVSVMLLSRETK